MQLALNIVNLNLDHARRGDILNAKEDVFAFLRARTGEEEGDIDIAPVRKVPILDGDGKQVVPFPEGFVDEAITEIEDDELRGLHKAGRDLFGSFVQHRDAQRRLGLILRGRPRLDATLEEVREAGGAPVIYFPISASWCLLPRHGGAKRGTALITTESVREAFLLKLLLMVLTMDTARIRSCPICEKLFVRTHRQEYCGSRCQGIATSRAYRKRKKEKLDLQRKQKLARKAKKGRAKK